MNPLFDFDGNGHTDPIEFLLGVGMLDDPKSPLNSNSSRRSSSNSRPATHSSWDSDPSSDDPFEDEEEEDEEEEW